MVRLFSNSEYIDIVWCMVKRAGVLFEPREFPCDFLWVHEGLGTTEEQVGNAATTIRNNRGILEFHRHLHYCIDNNGGPFEHFL
jgi:hypothetical protein